MTNRAYRALEMLGDKEKISKDDLLKIKFDIIIISPGINIFNCKLSKFLKLNKKKIYTDLDVFYSF